MIPLTDRVPTVLVVDDEPCVISTLSAALRYAGYAVLCAGTPGAALATALYTEEPIDLLIADVVMPGISGPEMARELQRYHPETRTLFITARPDTDEVRREVTGRGFPLLTKPFVVRVFLDKVKEILATRWAGTGPGSAKHLAASRGST